MNGLDIFLIILIVLSIIGGIVLLVWASVDGAVGAGIVSLISLLGLAGLLLLPFIVLDKGSGSTIGKITSVDKNFFGTTAVYIKTSETEQEKYCIEFNEELENKAKELIGKNVKISYGTRVGLYSTGKCSQAPIQKIELIEKEN